MFREKSCKRSRKRGRERSREKTLEDMIGTGDREDP